MVIVHEQFAFTHAVLSDLVMYRGWEVRLSTNPVKWVTPDQRQRYIASEHAHRASSKDTTRQHTGDNGWLRLEILCDFDHEGGLECEQNAELMQLWMDSLQSRHIEFYSDNFEYTDDDGGVIYVRHLTHMAPPRTRGEVRGERVLKAVM